MKKQKGMLFYKFYIYIRPIITFIIFILVMTNISYSNFMNQFHTYKICYIGFNIILLSINLMLILKDYNKSPGTYYFVKKVIIIELILSIILYFMQLDILGNYEISEISYNKITSSFAASVIWFISLNKYINERKEILMYNYNKQNKRNKLNQENSILDKYNELIKLDELRKKEIITEEEFKKEKAKLLK